MARESLMTAQSLWRIVVILSTNRCPDPDRVVRLAAFVDQTREQIGFRMDPPSIASDASAISILSTMVSDDEYARAWDAGRLLSWDDAVAEAEALADTTITSSQRRTS
jgi:hypothetical protein